MVGSTRVDCKAWLLGNLNLLCVVIPVSLSGASVSWTTSGSMMVSDEIVISLPSGYICEGGICFGGARNSHALPSNWVFNGSKISVNLVSTNNKQPYQVTSVFSLS